MCLSFDDAPAGGKLQAAEVAVAISPEFHTLGDPQPVRKRATVAGGASHEPRSYKAVVVVFMAGGADTFNMLVPMNTNGKLYDEYRAALTNMALRQEDLLEIPTTGKLCTKFGVHKSMQFLKSLYTEGQLGFAGNLGNLADSHSDQQTGAQTLKCQVMGATPKGGRMADALANQGFTTTSFSVAGAVPWPKGHVTMTEMIDRSSGARRITNFERLEDVIVNITSMEHNNVYCEEYSRQVLESVASIKKLGYGRCRGEPQGSPGSPSHGRNQDCPGLRCGQRQQRILGLWLARGGRQRSHVGPQLPCFSIHILRQVCGEQG